MTTGETIINRAKQFKGWPYSWGGGNAAGPTFGTGSGANIRGFDCSGLTLCAYAAVGINLPHYAQTQGGMGTQVTQAQARPGDLIYWSNINGYRHVAIYLGGNRMIDSAPSGGVAERNIYSGVTSYRRIYTEEDDMTPFEMLTAQFEVSPGRWVNVAQALSAIYFYGDRNEFTPKKVWDFPLKHSISGAQVPAEAFLRYEPKEHQNTRDIIINAVLAALADMPGVNAEAAREAVTAGVEEALEPTDVSEAPEAS